MLSISGRRFRLCDGVTRREALKIGALGVGGLTLPELLRAEAQAGVGSSHAPRKNSAVIMIYLAGAPPHQDMYDLKMDAPSEIRGEFRPIKTNVPGIEICELLPRMARIMDKLVPLRSVYGALDDLHNPYMCYTGRRQRTEPPGGWPSFPSCVSKLLGPRDASTPPFVGLSPKTRHRPYGSPGRPGFLGPSHACFRPSGQVGQDMVLNDISLDRLSHRQELLRSFDQFRRQVDTSGVMDAMDAFQQSAMGILTSNKLVEALDLSKEDPKVRERYGKGDPEHFADGPPRNLEHFLLARRLVEAGVRVVTVNFGRWDFHEDNFKKCKGSYSANRPGRSGGGLPWLDHGITALVEDLHQRGLDKDVTVVAWSEFGRTPRINKNAGRDHWLRVGGGLLAGGGMKTGQVIGATDRLGGEPADRPVHFAEVIATLYHNLGIDVTTTVEDLSGRPRYLVDPQYKPLPELL